MFGRRKWRPGLATIIALLLVVAGCGSDDEAELAASDDRAQPATPPAPETECEPIPADALGPFYEPGAPVRSSVGDGYVLSGRVLSARDCKPISDAVLELWLVNPDGEYDDAHRATLPVGADGRYRFESNAPVAYEGRPPHIHVRVTAPDQAPFVTQHYPEEGNEGARFDITLPPG